MMTFCSPNAALRSVKHSRERVSIPTYLSRRILSSWNRSIKEIQARIVASFYSTVLVVVVQAKQDAITSNTSTVFMNVIESVTKHAKSKLNTTLSQLYASSTNLK